MKVTEILTDLMAEKEVSEEKEDAALIPSYEGKVNKRTSFLSNRKIPQIDHLFPEISRETESTFKGWVKEVSKAPAPKQIGIGAACGWVSGYVMMKVGKAAATAVGGSLILLQIAHYKGYVTVDWNRLTNDTSSLSDRMKQKLRLKTKSTGEKMLDFAQKNIYLAGGFTGGFFIGIASS